MKCGESMPLIDNYLLDNYWLDGIPNDFKRSYFGKIILPNANTQNNNIAITGVPFAPDLIISLYHYQSASNFSNAVNVAFKRENFPNPNGESWDNYAFAYAHNSSNTTILPANYVPTFTSDGAIMTIRVFHNTAINPNLELPFMAFKL